MTSTRRLADMEIVLHRLDTIEHALGALRSVENGDGTAIRSLATALEREQGQLVAELRVQIKGCEETA